MLRQFRAKLRFAAGRSGSLNASMAKGELMAGLSLFAARMVAGIVFIPHGGQHLFGAFGGSGLSRFVQAIGPVAYLVAVGEVFGALALIVGLGSRFSAASLIVVMLGAIRVHAA